MDWTRDVTRAYWQWRLWNAIHIAAYPLTARRLSKALQRRTREEPRAPPAQVGIESANFEDTVPGIFPVRVSFDAQ